MVAIYDVLKTSKGIHVDDTFAELWGRKLSNAYTVETYTGTLPTTLQTVRGYLESYKIYGSTVQDGTPTPENPIIPSGCGERTGNLFDKDRTVGIISNVYIDQSGKQISGSKNYDLSYPIEVLENSVYTWSFVTGTNSLHSAPTVAFYDINDELLGVAIHKSNIKHFTFRTPLNTKYIRGSVYKGYSPNTTMFLKGGTQIADTASMDYIPYGYETPISSANTTTPVYLGEVQTTRRIKKLVLTGTSADGNSNVTAQGVIFITPTTTLKNVGAAYCTHFKYVNQSQGSGMPDNSFTTSGGPGTSLWFKTNYASVADFKSYLAAQYAAGTPVTVWYVLAEPETAVVNAPLMKIGDYADTIDSTQSTVQIPTAAGETTISWAGEGLAPSEVELTYRKRKGQ